MKPPEISPLKRMDGEPVFDEPWQAQILAIADTLISDGKIAPGTWSEALGLALAERAEAGAADTAQTYYEAALAALESVLAANAGISRTMVDKERDAWAAGYRETPHGRPVVPKRP